MKVLVVYKKSVYQIYVQEYRDASIIRALKRGDPQAVKLLRNHESQQQALRRTLETLGQYTKSITTVARGDVPPVKGADLVVTVGGDGTVLDTACKITSATPLLGINANPQVSVGALCVCHINDFARYLKAAWQQKIQPTQLTRLRVSSAKKQDLLGPCLNDILFAHTCPAELSRFQLTVTTNDNADHQLKRMLKSEEDFAVLRSSGIWTSTATGSTAAIKSAGGKAMRRDLQDLQFFVREPFVSKSIRAKSTLKGFIEADHSLLITSRMREGRIWADGSNREITIHYGDQIIIDRHPKDLRLFTKRLSPKTN